MGGNPRQPHPARDSSKHPNPAPGRSPVEGFGELVDSLRQLYTDFGLRPYRVFSVLIEWSGGQVGVGTARVVREQEFLPTPLVELDGLKTTPKDAGKVEEGGAWLKELSPRLTESDVESLVGARQQGQETFVEVQHDARDGVSPRRRFSVHGVPMRDVGGFQWKVRLIRARPDRKADGALDERTALPERLLNPLMVEE
jgi:hypothetical protein